MDITETFKECLRRVRQTHKVVKDILNDKSKEDKRLLSRRKLLTEFNRDAKGLVTSITDLKNYLLQNRKDYINIYSPLLSLASMMTDRERDELDDSVEEFVRVCNEKAIQSLRAQANRSKLTNNNQLAEHQNNLIDLILAYLKSVIDIHSQQRAIRIKRAVEKQRLLRLGNIISRDKCGTKTKDIANGVESKQQLNSNDRETVKPLKEAKDEDIKEFWTKQDKTEPKIVDSQQTDKNTEPKTLTIPVTTASETNDETYQQLELTNHELQAFEEENKFLFNQMNSLGDEVKDIELKVIEIAKLQEIFTENVLKQEVDLNRLSDSTISSTENIRSGNQQLREAMKKNAGFRVWILFFITTLAFTILFLDWYNP